MKWKRVTIFISSTFNDMHAERDYLVKDVFPELRDWCEERKLHLVDVDLRWGVTEADSSSNNTVLACLNNIDESRPFFLCFLGQRRGWVPKIGEVSLETLNEYPDVSDRVGRLSVTEMEIEHALLSPMRHIVNGNEKQEIPVNHALFYFRDPGYLESLTDAQREIFTNEGENNINLADLELKNFKDKIKDNWDYTVDYGCNWDINILSPELQEDVNQGRLTDFSAAGKDLKDIIIEQLKEEIIKEFPDREKVVYTSDLERDLDQQALFIELNSEGFISRAGDFDDLNDYVINDKNGLFVLAASAGYGKSMLLANFIKRESKKHNAKFFNRFCGVSDLCSQQYSLWKTIFDEAGVACPNTLKKLKDKIEDLLKELVKGKTVLIIDAINQLSDGLDMLEWLPKQLPKNLKIILSLKVDEEDKELATTIEKKKEDENFSCFPVRPFEEMEEKKKLIKDYLKKYLKALDDNKIEAICDFEGSKNPLYLKVILSELRVFGSFDQLTKIIQQFGETPKTAFNTVLNRLEKDINSLNIDSEKITSLLFGLLAIARNGLSEKELTSSIQKELSIDKEKLIQTIRLFIRQVRPFMARREGRTDYFYEAFKLAAKERYSSDKIHYNQICADYFKKQADPEDNFSFKGKSTRDFNELPYHLNESKNINYIQKILSTYLWIKNKSELSDIYNTINDYNYIDVENMDNYHTKLIKDTLVMSSHILKDFITNLPSQLWGRLKDIENPQIKELITEIDKHTDYPWLKPRHHMNSPEDALTITIAEHTDYVNSVCFSPDGKYIVSASDDTTIRVWDWKHLKEVAKLKNFWPVRSMCVSPNGKYIAFSSSSTTRIWDWKKEEEIAVLKGRTHNVHSVCFSPDGKYIVSGSGGLVNPGQKKDNTILVWEWKKQKEVAKFAGHTEVVRSVSFSPDGKYIVSGSEDKTIRVWNWKKKIKIAAFKVLKIHTHMVRSICFSSNGKYIVVGLGDETVETVRVWDWKEKQEITKIEGYTSEVKSACFSPDGKYIVSSSKAIRIWDWKEQKEIAVLRGHTRSVNSVYFSPDGKHIVSGSDDRTIRVWEWEKQKITTEAELVGYVNCVCFSPDDKYIVSGTNYKIVSVFEWEKQQKISELEGHTSSVKSVCFSPDGKYIATGANGYRDRTVRVWDWKTQQEISKINAHSSEEIKVCFSPDGKYIATGALGRLATIDHTVRVWDWEKRKIVSRLKGYYNGVESVCFSPDGKYVFAGTRFSSGQDTDNIWNWKKQEIITQLDGYRCTGLHVCFSPDGKYIVRGGDNAFRVWDWEKRQIMWEPEGYSNTVTSVCFSSDGKYVVSGSRDQTIRIWKWENQKDVQNPIIILNTDEEIYSCTFSNNNHQIAAGGASGQILIYDVKNISFRTAIVTALRDLSNNLSVRCKHCGNVSAILEEKLGNIVKCPHCGEELQVNNFTADTIIVEDESIEV
jgi:WD40 repeat protein